MGCAGGALLLALLVLVVLIPVHEIFGVFSSSSARTFFFLIIADFVLLATVIIPLRTILSRKPSWTPPLEPMLWLVDHTDYVQAYADAVITDLERIGQTNAKAREGEIKTAMRKALLGL